MIVETRQRRSLPDYPVAVGPFEAAADGPALNELKSACEVDVEFVVVALDAGRIARFDSAVEQLALPPDRPAAELVLAVDIGARGPRRAAEAVPAGGEGQAGPVDAGPVFQPPGKKPSPK